MNKILYRKKMKEHGDTNSTLAKALGISAQRNSAKLNGTRGAEYNCAEICLIKLRWGLTAEEVDSIFFNVEVS